MTRTKKMAAGEMPVVTRKESRVVYRALALKREGIFGLLVILTALLGWVVALGAGSAVLLQGVYDDWSLSRQQTVTVYLPPDSEPATVTTLTAALATEPGVAKVARVPDATLKSLLEPYGGLTGDLPVPVVLDVLTARDFDRAVLDQRVRAAFPTAELDDARNLLASVAKGVRLTQLVGLGVAAVMVAIMLGLVVLTVRVGLKSQQATLALLRQLGASDDRLVRLVMTQVGERALYGWCLAAAAAVVALGVLQAWWPAVQPLVGWPVWLAMIAAPGALPLVTVVSAAATARAQLRDMV